MDAEAAMRAANFCATTAFGLLLTWALMEFIEWSESKKVPPGQWCSQHRKAKHECREEHRP